MAARPEWLNEVALVWTPENRPGYDRRGQRYPSDLTDEEWSVLEPLLPVAKGKGRPRTHTLREIMNAIRYVQRYGIPWDAVPRDLPPGSICYDYWRLLSDGGHLESINHCLVMTDREKAGREASPTLAIVDAQSVKCDAPQGERGYDAAKKVVGRKRHLAVDIEGRLLAVKVTRADVQDQDGGMPLVERLVRLCPWIETIVVDGGYKNRFIDAVQTGTNRIVQVVKRPEFARGFFLLPKRWRVEQTIGALTISRRLKIDYETLIRRAPSLHAQTRRRHRQSGNHVFTRPRSAPAESPHPVRQTVVAGQATLGGECQCWADRFVALDRIAKRCVQEHRLDPLLLR